MYPSAVARLQSDGDHHSLFCALPPPSLVLIPRANKQLQYHAQDLLAPALPTEKCRRLMHLLVIAFNMVNVLLFSLLLRDEIRWFIIVMSAIQILPSMSGVLGIRLWMHT